jgi:hypothetical protein
MMLLELILVAAPPTTFQRVYASYRDTNFGPFAHGDQHFAPRLQADR